ncbi:MAG: hypothetical protein E6575_18755, partial [Bradyrhizobium sp.]|nr:hypothetical protein [Bradyrhizobium sp.]
AYWAGRRVFPTWERGVVFHDRFSGDCCWDCPDFLAINRCRSLAVLSSWPDLNFVVANFGV